MSNTSSPTIELTVRSIANAIDKCDDPPLTMPSSEGNNLLRKLHGELYYTTMKASATVPDCIEDLVKADPASRWLTSENFKVCTTLESAGSDASRLFKLFQRLAQMRSKDTQGTSRKLLTQGTGGEYPSLEEGITEDDLSRYIMSSGKDIETTYKEFSRIRDGVQKTGPLHEDKPPLNAESSVKLSAVSTADHRKMLQEDTERVKNMIQETNQMLTMFLRCRIRPYDPPQLFRSANDDDKLIPLVVSNNTELKGINSDLRELSGILSHMEDYS